MKILFIGQCGIGDYQQDSTLHGLKSLFGSDCVDVPKIEYMYSSYGDTSKLYGRGFTLFGLLPDLECDREDIVRKLRNNYFDLAIYGSIRRSRQYRQHVTGYMQPHKIVAVDGEDDQDLFPTIGWRFKRELARPTVGYWPIQFAIPEEKIVGPLEKKNFMAPLDPCDKSTYIYNTERDYYRQYQESVFGRTQKKAGWDCMRHYEIMACGSIPYFPDLNMCPESTMVLFPKTDVLGVMRDLEPSGGTITYDRMDAVICLLQNHLRNKLTTKSLARYVLDTVMK